MRMLSTVVLILFCLPSLAQNSRFLLATIEGCEAEDLKSMITRELIPSQIRPQPQQLQDILISPLFQIECGLSFCDVYYSLDLDVYGHPLTPHKQTSSPNLSITLDTNVMGRARFFDFDDSTIVHGNMGTHPSNVRVFFNNSSMINFRARLEFICESEADCILVEDVVVYIPYDDDLKCGSLSQPFHTFLGF
jgi:hypothetical protein